MRPYYESGGVTLFHGDARDMIAEMPLVDSIMTDPVWPNPIEMAGSDAPYELFAEVAAHFPALTDRVVVTLGCQSDPRFLMGIPPALPYLRTCWLRYLRPRYRGTVLDGADVAFVFGRNQAPEGKTLISGEYMVTVAGQRKVDAHPCPRNPWHTAWLMKTFSHAGHTVLDPFAGSGTMLVIAYELHRRAIGIEIEERWCEVAARWLEDVRRQGRMFEEALVDERLDREREERD